jgi:hypothetical protein
VRTFERPACHWIGVGSRSRAPPAASACARGPSDKDAAAGNRGYHGPTNRSGDRGPGANLSEVTGVTIGGTPVTILKTATTKVIVSVPSGLKGGIVAVTSQAGSAVSSTAVTVA